MELISAKKAKEGSDKKWDDQIKIINEEITKAIEKGEYNAKISYEKLFGEKDWSILSTKYKDKYIMCENIMKKAGYKVESSINYLYIDWSSDKK